MDWTAAQKDAISYNKNNDVLIAAAAGSGKTAVLVERIIQKILSSDDPVSVDELLVLTFTDAAAKEMKNKISNAIDKKLKEQPENRHLKRQSIRVASADISTIHAFAKKIIQNNIHLTDIPAGFSIIDTAENEFLLDEALDACLERYYSNIDKVPAFAELAAGYGGIKNDNALRSEILKLHSFSMSMAQPEKWLSSSADMYREAAQSGTVLNTAWGDIYLNCIKNHIRHILGYYDIMNEIAEEYFFEDDKLTVFLKNETQMLKNILDFESLDEYFDYIPRIKFATRPAVKTDDELLSAAAKRIATFRDTAKKKFSQPGFMKFKTAEEASEPIIRLWPRIKTLKNIVLMLMRKHKKLKRKNSYLDFNDLEHELIKLLMNADGTPTEFCSLLGSKYKEILVDEYQDTNNIQDTLFRLLSGGRGNIFMVGDLKQSIYGFRNASPELFLDKYRRFGKDGEYGSLIKLSNNFRSRSAVVDTVNFVFRQLMHEENADIEYTEDEYLNQSAVYDGADDEAAYCTEMIMTDVIEGGDTPNNRSGRVKTAANKTELEAESIAKRIIRLVYEDKLLVTDKQSGERRPIEFGDIVILCRSPKNTAPVIESVFYRYGIPVNSSVQTGFLNSLEIRTVLSFLEIIDNPLQDIPLVAVLRSSMFGFTADELAEIRSGKRRGCFYDALCAAAENGNAKAAEFIEVLNSFRKRSAYMGVHELIYLICHELDYEAAVTAMPGGELRKANLRLLFDRASNFERTSLKGLFSFVSYLERVDGSKTEMSQGKANGGPAVTVTTIHKSKGLEYPVVVLADTFSSTPHSDTFAYNAHCGIGMNYVDTKTRIKYPCPTIELIKSLNHREETAEEMRILYVALTRAREKLIISCTNDGRGRGWLSPYINCGGCIAPALVEATDVFRDWLVYAFLCHKDADGLRDIMTEDLSDIIPANDGGSFKFDFIPNTTGTSGAESIDETDKRDVPENAEYNKENKLSELSETNEAHTPTEQAALTAEDIERVFGFEYPHDELTHIPLKLTVSEIKERLTFIDNTEDGGYTPAHSSIADRSFKEALRSKAADTGTITHFVLQHIDPAETDTPELVNEQVAKMTANGMISEVQAAAVNTKLIYELFQTELGGRIKKAAHSNTLSREFKFLIPIDACEVYHEIKNDSDSIIVQGIIDCFFFEGDDIVLVDYKTDNCTADNAAKQAEKYRVQADFYARGLEMIYGRRVKEKIICFLKPQTAIAL